MTEADLPSPPPAAAEVFGDALGRAREFAGLLATEGVTRGLIGPREAPRLWDRHLLNCAVVAELLPESGQLVDIGSGAGLPGMVLAMMRPEVEVVLLEPMLRRVAFLHECVQALGLENASVVRGRAEEFSGKVRADFVTARAVAPLDKLAGWASGLLRPGGTILAIKGQTARDEVSAARPVLSRLGARSIEVVQVGHDRVVRVSPFHPHGAGSTRAVPDGSDERGSLTTVVRVVLSGRGREEQAGAHRRRPGVA